MRRSRVAFGDLIMLTKVRCILGKLFLSSASFFWICCDNANSDFPVSPPNIADQKSSSSCLTNENTSSSSYFNENLSSNDAFSSSSAEPTKKAEPFIDIEQEMAKLPPLDTSGLRGKCILEQTHCETIENYNGYFNYKNKVIRKAKDKFHSLINNEQNVSFPDWKKRCYEDAIGMEAYPIYGVSACRNPNRKPKIDESCEIIESVRIDDDYLKALQKNDSLERYVNQKELEQINENVAKCESYD